MAGFPAALAAGALSGAATALAFPPHDVGLLAFFSLIPLALVFRAGEPKHVAAAAGVFGLVFFGLLFPWIHLFGTAAYVLLVVLEAAFVVVFLLAGLVLRHRLPAVLAPLAFGTAVLTTRARPLPGRQNAKRITYSADATTYSTRAITLH